MAGGITEVHEHGYAVHLMLIPARGQDIAKLGILAPAERRHARGLSGAVAER